MYLLFLLCKHTERPVITLIAFRQRLRIMKLIKDEIFNLYPYLYLTVNDLISSGCLHPLLAASHPGRGMRDGPVTKQTALLLLLDQPSPDRPWSATRLRKKDKFDRTERHAGLVELESL